MCGGWAWQYSSLKSSRLCIWFVQLIAAWVISLMLPQPNALASPGKESTTREERGTEHMLKLRIQSLKILNSNELGLAHDFTKQANSYKDRGQFSKAEPLYQSALAIYQSPTLGDNRSDKALCLESYASLLRQCGRHAHAQKLEADARTIWERLWANYTYAGVLAEENEDLESAEMDFLHALQHAQRFEPQYGRLLSSLDNLVLLYNKQGRYPEAEPLLKKSLDIHAMVFGLGHKKTTTILDQYSEILRKNNHFEQADELQSKARAAHVKLAE